MEGQETERMSTSPVATRPLSVGLPWVPPSGELLTKSQWRTVIAILNTVVPPVCREDTSAKASTNRASLAAFHLPAVEYDKMVHKIEQHVAASPDKAALRSHEQKALLEAYLAERPSDNPLFTELLTRIVSHPAGQETAASAGAVFAEVYLDSGAPARSPPFRSLFKSMTSLGKLLLFRTSTLFYDLSGFPPAPPTWAPSSSTSPHHQYSFLQFSPPPPASPSTPITITADIVIIGSGCGAAIAAHRLATTLPPTTRILVLEKGYQFSAASDIFPMTQADGMENLFESGAVIEADDGSINVTAGSCFGGGGTVNWSACLQAQHFVRCEWSQQRGLPYFESAAYQASLDGVFKHMGAGAVTPNHGNAVLLEGARKLGYEAKMVPQNCGGAEHEDGYCTLGCWKRRWGRSRGFLFEEGGGKGGKKVVRGVKGVWTMKEGGKEMEVVVRARQVVVSCGTLWSPVVLANSGLKNPQIGKNLYLHPTNFVSGFFDEDVRPWEGGALTSVVSSFDNLDGKGHGVRLEAMNMMPAFCLPFLNWSSGAEYKTLVSKYRHMNMYIAITRDRDTGYIYPDPLTGFPRVAYTPSAFDRAHNLVGIVSLAKILYAQGASEIHPSLPGLRPFVCSKTNTTAQKQSHTTNETEEITDPLFLAWLSELQAHGNKTPVTPFGSAHQVGTCRMSATERGGVVDPRGGVWGTEGLYVADASVFPSASGVNPMVTTMAIADYIAQGTGRDCLAAAAAGAGAGGDKGEGERAATAKL
ncbi:hypothetical protein B0T17DRAFT_611027 [Bombardia bombarda]|uniref:Long-chain-alcohol oxidase n=1 Tax=Bombardia bombarda TaxID=252184 RepID=A0AA39W3Y8_9PEZI|nr:hypothetical protein B0T17DRAFT_611027 [Bombardia bombarda]